MFVVFYVETNRVQNPAVRNKINNNKNLSEKEENLGGG